MPSLAAILSGVAAGGKILETLGSLRRGKQGNFGYTPQPSNRSIDYGGFNRTGYGQMLNNALGSFDRQTTDSLKDIHNITSQQGPSQQQLMGAMSATGRGSGMQAWKAAQNQAQINAGNAYLNFAQMRQGQKYNLMNQYGAGQNAYAGQQLQQQGLNMQQQQINMSGRDSSFNRLQASRANSFGRNIGSMASHLLGSYAQHKMAKDFGLYDQQGMDQDAFIDLMSDALGRLTPVDYVGQFGGIMQLLGLAIPGTNIPVTGNDATSGVRGTTGD